MQIQDQNEEEKTLTPIRETEVDIIKGASNTDQLEAMQANAAQHANSDTPVKQANILEVNDGSVSSKNVNTDVSKDSENPAIRGI